MRTYRCDCGCVEHLVSMIPDCCSLCGGYLEQISGPPQPDDEFHSDRDQYAGFFADELDFEAPLELAQDAHVIAYWQDQYGQGSYKPLGREFRESGIPHTS